MSHLTKVSTLEISSSFKSELLFGCYQKKLSKEHREQYVGKAFDYIFSHDQIFGIRYESTGKDFKKFNYAFVLRTCAPGEEGHLIPGIFPGAEVLVKAIGSAQSKKLMDALDKIQKNNIDLTSIDLKKYKFMDQILQVNLKQSFFIKELIYGY